MSTLYLYGIIPTPNHHQFDLNEPEATGPGQHVYLLPYGNVAAVVSDSPLSSYDGLTREQVMTHLMRHQKIVERVMENYPILPIKFGTFLPDEVAVQRLLIQQEAVFTALLEKIAYTVQMEVVVLWEMDTVFAEIKQDATLRQIKAEMASLSGEAMTAKQVEAGQRVKTLLDARRRALQAEILPRLQAVAESSVLNPVMDDSMILNVALLLQPQQEDALDVALMTLDDQFEGKLMFRCVGPLPVHSFATIEINTFSFEAIDAARQILHLEAAATPHEVKKAYHRLAAMYHPDHRPMDAAAESRMATLSDAYKLLMQYTHSQSLQAATEMRLCHFDRASVEQAALVDIQTQIALSR